MAIIDQEALLDRANSLADKGYNGIKLVLVRLETGGAQPKAILTVYFYNTLGVADIQAALNAAPQLCTHVFPISGGHRLRGGAGEGQVKVQAVVNAGADYLELDVRPIGDYSTYILELDCTDIAFKNIDPMFSEKEFKFRPGCFSMDCAPEWKKGTQAEELPSIDYLAKDYASFRHLFISTMMHRVPDWQPTSEADLDMVLLEIMCKSADELSDYQDRVMGEAYLTSARKRVSLARHARLMDYHIHQGQQASTVLALELGPAKDYTGSNQFSSLFVAWSGVETLDLSAQVFVSKKKYSLHTLLNKLSLFTWSGSKPALAAGSTSADLVVVYGEDETPDAAEKMADAQTIQNLIRSGELSRLLIEEKLNPDTGAEAGRNPDKRQLLQLLSGDDHCIAKQDPISQEVYLHVEWEPKDQLQYNYCFTIQCPEKTKENVSLFCGNLLDVFHGQPEIQVFKAPGSRLEAEHEHYFEPTERYGTLCKLDLDAPLAYRETPMGNENAPKSTLSVSTFHGEHYEWNEEINLVHSTEEDRDFIVETDENGQSVLRFGNGTNGKAVAWEDEITCVFQTGKGTDGNVGRNKIIQFDRLTYDQKVLAVWNPFDVSNGRNPEPVEEILRRVQEAYLARQMRAVTEEDYQARAEELPEVAKASAIYLWTGSWRTVRVSIDPKGGTTLSPVEINKIARHLEAVRLLGEDLELRLPKYVPVIIKVELCVHPDYWIEDVRSILDQEFCDGYTPDGRMGFFHPDLWTFGTSLYASQILGRIQAIPGVDHVRSIEMQRWNECTPGDDKPGVITVRENEIILVKNDPDHMETGTIEFDPKGGRR